MAGKRQATLREAKALLGKKRGLKKPVRFPKPQIAGTVIYSNPKAIAVPRSIGERGKREPFSIRNVEWISFRPFPIGWGGHGKIFWGKIKFKGKTSSQRVVLKEFHSMFSSAEAEKTREVIARLERSGVPHPKMVFLECNRSHYLVMEPFIKSGEFGAESKFVVKNEDLVHDLDFVREQDRDIFRQVVKHAARLAKAGLRLRYSADYIGNRVDAFNAIPLRNRRKKVFVQDLDTFLLGEDAKQNWRKSTHFLLEALAPFARTYAKRVIDKVAEKEGF